MSHVRDKVDTSIRHVGANLGHDKWIQVQCVMVPHLHVLSSFSCQELGQGKGRRVTVFPTNPLRLALLGAAERISRSLGWAETEAGQQGEGGAQDTDC